MKGQSILQKARFWPAWLLAAHLGHPQAMANPAGPVSNPVAAEAPAPHPELRTELPSARRLGTAKLNVWGFDIYNATLWTQPGFESRQYMQHSFALDLAYLRAFEGSAIVKRSIDEMKRLGTISPERAQAWQAAMAEVFPNVKAGDRITGLHRAGSGAVFWLNGKARGEIRDVEFARLFFGIWLSESTSEPAMRQSLLGHRPA